MSQEPFDKIDFPWANHKEPPATDKRECPFCGEFGGVYVQQDANCDERLRFAVECVCGVIGAPRETEAEAIKWWNSRQSPPTEQSHRRIPEQSSDNLSPESQPPATEQEWTVEPCVGAISGQEWMGLSYIRAGNHRIGSLNAEVAKAICDAHKSELRRVHTLGWDDAVRSYQKVIGEFAGDIVAAQLELDAEREETERWKQNGVNLAAGRYNLEKQLLAAQAAIAELHKLIWSDGYPSIYAFRAVMGRTPELFALDKHDAEIERKCEQRCARGLCKGAALFAKSGKEHDDRVRKPLVDVLETIASNNDITGTEAMLIAADALAKITADAKTDRA